MKKNRINKLMLSILLSALMLLCVPAVVFAEEVYTCTLFGKVTDAGQVVSYMEIDFQDTQIAPESVDTATFSVHAVGSSEETQMMFNSLGMKVAWNGDYSIYRKIVKTEVDGSIIRVYFDESEGATLSYLTLEGDGIPSDAGTGRNFPVALNYTITQNKKIITTDGQEIENGRFSCDGRVIDRETEKFQSVIVKDGINYQYHAGTNDTLIVWFHGGGEGDQDDLTENNVSQMLANRGTVAWASPEAQSVFGDSTVMAFQAPNRWYQGEQAALYSRVYDEIMKVVRERNISKDKIIVAGCSMGGYMTTKMLAKYPGLFKVALISCPDILIRRVEPIPTIEELQKIRESGTSIWLVQGATDSSVKGETSQYFFDVLSDGQEVYESRHEQALSSGYTTFETADGKYKRTVYDTIDEKILVAEDYDQDGIETAVAYSDHWTWIYTLRNNARDGKDTQIWQWTKQNIVR